jgi:hypothetical protein
LKNYPDKMIRDLPAWAIQENSGPKLQEEISSSVSVAGQCEAEATSAPLLPLMTISETAAILHLAPRTIRRMIRSIDPHSARQTAPSEVTLADLEAYRQAILDDRLRNRPEATWERLSWTWNTCQRNVEGWPAIRIERVSRRKIYVMPWSAFPASFKQDVDRFLDRLAGADLSDDGPIRPARPATLQMRGYQLRLAASVLVHRGHDAQSIRAIADLLSIERYQEILRFFLDRRGGQTSPQIGHLAAALKDIARHWVKVDAPTLERFKRIASRLAVPRRGMTAKNRDRLRPFDDPDTIATFLALPQRLRREVNTAKRNPRRRAVLAQMAAAIALLQAGTYSAEKSYRYRCQRKSHRARQQALPRDPRGRGEEP